MIPIYNSVRLVPGLPTIFHVYAHHVPAEERSRAFGYLIAAGGAGQTVAAVVSDGWSTAVALPVCLTDPRSPVQHSPRVVSPANPYHFEV